MPRLPKWLNNTMETVFSGMMHPVTVTAVEYLDVRLKKVRFEGELQKAKFIPGNVIEFRVSDTDFRHYTPSCFDADKGVCEVLFYLHDGGIGSAWAANLNTGDKVKLIGPGGKISYNEASPYHFFFGDETSIGLCCCIKHIVLSKHQTYLCVLELEEAHKSWPRRVGMMADVVGKSFNDPGQEAVKQIAALRRDIAGYDPMWEQTTFYLTGRARSIQAVRKALLAEGIRSRQIQTEPYWAEGKQGL